MKIYRLTSAGRSVARSVTNPATSPYRIVHYLDQRDAATVDQVADNLGMSTSEASMYLGRLQRNRPKIVEEAVGAGV